MTVSTKNRGVRALITAGIAGASLVAVSMTGSPASGQKNCYYPDIDKVARYYYCTPETRPEITVATTAPTTTEATIPTTTEATTTTEGNTPTTAGPTTTAAPTTTAPAGVGGAGAARPIAAQASYAG